MVAQVQAVLIAEQSANARIVVWVYMISGRRVVPAQAKAQAQNESDREDHQKTERAGMNYDKPRIVACVWVLCEIRHNMKSDVFADSPLYVTVNSYEADE